jgi:hypothetical protein
VKKIDSVKSALYLILTISLLLRVLLVFSGGQFFWPDEQRYAWSQDLAQNLSTGNYKGAIISLAAENHLFFTAVSTIPALIQVASSPDPRIPAAFFSLFSVLCIYLTYKIALKLGATDNEALIAALLLSCSATFFYYARHILPYDLSMAVGLFAVWIAIRRSQSAINSILLGLISSVCFLAYNGYWALAVLAMLTGLIYPERTIRGIAARGVLIGMGFSISLIFIQTISILTNYDVFEAMISFSASVVQGEFSEGWKLPFEYLWHAEHLLLVVWVLTALGGLIYAYGRMEGSERFVLALGGLVFMYGSLVIFSVFIEKFVVYGRMVRQMIPFLCLASAFVLEKTRTLFPRGKLWAASVLLLLLQAGLNFFQPLAQEFPDRFRDRANEIIAAQSGDFDILYAEFIYPLPDPLPERPFEVIVSSPHPLQFKPFLYEGSGPEARKTLEELDINMLLIHYTE